MERPYMTSQINDFSLHNWLPYPATIGRLSRFQLVNPVSMGFYGQPNSQLLISSNHKTSLADIGQLTDAATLVLDGGGFPVEVAAAFDLISESQLEQVLIARQEIAEWNGTLLVPYSLAVAWKLKAGQAYLGNTVKIISDSFVLSDVLPPTKIPGIAIRFMAALRLVLGQIFLITLPVLIINSNSILWVILSFLLAAFLLAMFWPIVPGNGWVKGAIFGAVCAGIAILPIIQLIPIMINFSRYLPIGIFMSFIWMGGILMGARSLNK